MGAERAQSGQGRGGRLVRAAVACLLGTTALIAGVLLTGRATAEAAVGCTMSVSPEAGPVGTVVSIDGSTSGCPQASGGGLFFADEYAGVFVGTVPGDGPFRFTFRVPGIMPSGTPAAAAQAYNGGGPVAPGPAHFGVFMGAPLPDQTFEVTSAPPGWDNYVAIAGPVGGCAGCNVGYYLFRSDGYLDALAGVNAPGNPASYRLAAPVVGATLTPDQAGYWTVGRDGGVLTFGDARYEGSLPGDSISVRDIVGVASTPDGNGYWLAGSDGGVFSFGDAHFYGSLGNVRLNKPIVGMAPTADGKGYWLVASDGGVFSFGDARFYGSMGGTRLDAPVSGIAAVPGGGGYWLVAQDGGVFTFGDAPFYNSAAGVTQFPVVGISPTGDGKGYWLLGRDGGVFSFGDAPFNGSGRAPLGI